MISNTISYGIFMLIENSIVIALLLDLIIRVGLKAYALRHPHVYWKSGIILFVYCLLMIQYTIGEGYISFSNYIQSTSPIAMWKVVGRVFITSIFLVANVLHYYYTVKWGFNLFQERK